MKQTTPTQYKRTPFVPTAGIPPAGTPVAAPRNCIVKRALRAPQ